MADAVPVTGYRSTIEDVAGGIAVSVPARRSLVVVAFLCAWLVGWLVGELRVIGQLSPSSATYEIAERLSLLYWLLAWTLGGAIGGVMLSWNLGGRERIVVQDHELSIRLSIFGIGFTRRYEKRFVKNLRVLEKPAAGKPAAQPTMAEAIARLDGPLAFDYASKTVQFGGGVEVTEALYLLSRLNAQFAQKPTDTQPELSS